VLSHGKEVTWEDIKGLADAKERIMDMVVTPMLRPDLYSTELLAASNGLLLFGPPGTGKTMLG
jgi:SpoVK/Ycf46/Vps4 family AAA+-type ATPase